MQKYHVRCTGLSPDVLGKTKELAASNHSLTSITYELALWLAELEQSDAYDGDKLSRLKNLLETMVQMLGQSKTTDENMLAILNEIDKLQMTLTQSRYEPLAARLKPPPTNRTNALMTSAYGKSTMKKSQHIPQQTVKQSHTRLPPRTAVRRPETLMKQTDIGPERHMGMTLPPGQSIVVDSSNPSVMKVANIDRERSIRLAIADLDTQLGGTMPSANKETPAIIPGPVPASPSFHGLPGSSAVAETVPPQQVEAKILERHGISLSGPEIARHKTVPKYHFVMSPSLLDNISRTAAARSGYYRRHALGPDMCDDLVDAILDDALRSISAELNSICDSVVYEMLEAELR